jgi:hypothetical protein
MSLRGKLVVGCASAIFAIAGCKEASWEFSSEARALDRDVAVALGDNARGWTDDITPTSVPEIRPPAALRPCCAFGADLQVKVGAIPVPGVSLSNVIGFTDLGPHRYDNGLVSLDLEDSRGWVDDEANGLVYTCRGGFIDTAHVRDNADITMALAAHFARTMDTDSVIEMPPQGAAIRVRSKAVNPQNLKRYGRRDIAIAAAEWAAFNLSIWHEIATWYGFASLASWPEKISAFSPEDLYSNLLGNKIAGGILHDRGARSDHDYDRNMDAWIERALGRLEAVPQASAKEAIRSVDGIWWDSSKRIPDWTLVLRRNSEIGTRISPWVVSRASGWDPASFTDCDGKGAPLVLRHPDGFLGMPFRRPLTLEFDVHDELVGQGFPLPADGSRVVTQEDFPRIIEVIRRENAAALGSQANGP